MKDARNRGIRYAVATSLLSKVAAIGVQIVAVPVAINALGTHQFGLYALLYAALVWVNLVGAGLAPTLTTEIVRHFADGNGGAIRAAFTTALLGATGGIVIGLLAIALIMRGGMAVVLGAGIDDIGNAIGIIAVLFGVSVICSVFEAARAGYQEGYWNNIASLCGNAFSACLLLFWFARAPSISNLVLSTLGATVLWRCFNGAVLMWQRRELRPRLADFDRRLLRLLLVSGLGFLAIQLSSLLAQQATVLIMGAQVGPSAAATLSVGFQLVNILGSAVLMISQPMIPAYADAVSRGDAAWIARAFTKNRLIVVAYAVGAALLLSFLGGDMIHIWTGGAIAPKSSALWLLGIYLLGTSWVHTYYSLFVAHGRVWFAAVVLLAEAILATLVCYWFATSLGDAAAPLGLALSSVCLSSVLFPLKARQWKLAQ